MKGYKAFGKGLVCKRKQYAENTVFEENEAEICKSGMHFCENPFDVLEYYPLVNENGEFSEFAPVEALDEVHTNDNKKFCTKKLKIGEKLTFAGFINAAVDFMTKSAMPKSGYGSQLAASGDGSKLAASGYVSKLAASGDGSQLAASGDGSKLAASGDGSKLAASGYGSQLAASGYVSKLAASGYGSQLSAGENSVICCAGHGCKAKAKKGSWITLSEWGYSVKKGRYVPKCVKTEYVDGKKIKADTWYHLQDGEFVEVREND